MTRPNESREFGNIDLVIEPGGSSTLGFEEPARYYQVLEGSCLVRYGDVMQTSDGRRISWREDGGGMEAFNRGDVFAAGNGRVISLRNRSDITAIIQKIES